MITTYNTAVTDAGISAQCEEIEKKKKKKKQQESISAGEGSNLRETG